MEGGREIEAHCPEHAVRQWAQMADAESADYLIVRGNPAEVLVCLVGSSLPPYRYSVSGESEPVYYARMLHSAASDSGQKVPHSATPRRA
jgi:hypothetical protein